MKRRNFIAGLVGAAALRPFPGSAQRPQTTPNPLLCTLLTQACAVSQTSGIDQKLYPRGLPSSYDWYHGGGHAGGYSQPPSGFTALTGWGQIYLQDGFPNPACHIFIKGFKTYIHFVGGGWSLVQDQATMRIDGAYYPADFHSYPNVACTKTPQSDGSFMIDAPAVGYNMHFYPGPRGTYTAGSVNGAFVVCQMRTDNPNANCIANMGADWWINSSVGYSRPETNSPGIGMSSWVKLSDTYQNFFFTNCTAANLASDPPPPIEGHP
jgi:hypothetical protein